MPALKSAALRAFAGSGLTALLRPLQRDAGVVFMLHRFADPRRGVAGHEPAFVRRALAYLRRHGHQIVSLDTLLDDMAGGRPVLHHAVAFTIDDGYAEQAAVAGPVFAEFDCPVTTFVATGFLDGSLWLWWDRIEYVLRHSEVAALNFEGPSGPVQYRLDAAGRRRARDEITSRCKRLTDEQRHGLIARLAQAAAIDLPEQPPAAYAPMTWDQARECERRGMTFGPHTVTHPILAAVDEHRSETEIRVSWARVKTELAAPVPIFAYPNGRTGDWSEREHQILRREGMRAVTAEPGFVTARHYQAENGPVLVPRFDFPDSYEDFVQIVGGLERLKMRLRGSAS